jgi:hypothetical protein
MSTAPSRSPLFDSRDPISVTKALHGLDGGLLMRVGDSLLGALNGSDNAARLYVRDYRRLTGCLLAEAKRVRPGRSTSMFAAVVENGSASAPFSPWTSRFELSDAIGLDLTNHVRELLGAHRLTVPAGGEENKHHALVVDEVNARRFLRRVRFHLNHPDDEEPLGRLADAFGLSKTELAGLFGVRRQAIDGWLANGVPAERQEKLVTLLDIVELLDRKLKAGRLPGVARRPADVYDGHTMLELISTDRHRELLGSIRASFDWSTAA